MIQVRKWIAALAACLACPCFAQQAGAMSADAAGVPERASIAATVTSAPDYQIGPEDVLEISVWKEEALQKQVVVRPDGGISFPLAGDIRAAGRTARELQLELVQRLGKFMPDPAVSVAVLKVAANRVYVIGKVNKPGEYVAGRYVDVLQALSMAGGLTPFAAENDIKVLRRQDGGDLVFPFRYSDAKRGERLEQNIILKAGDIVVVP